MAGSSAKWSGPLTLTDVKLDPDQIPAPGSPAGAYILIQGCEPWTMAREALSRAGLAPCPACEGRPLPRRSYCLVCDRASTDGRVLYPGLPVDSHPDPDWRDDRDRPSHRRTG